MRNTLLLENVDASIQQISEAVNLDQRAQWKLTISSSLLYGTPQLFIEQGFNGGKCFNPPTEWVTLCNPLNETNGSFLINDNLITIEKKDFKGNWFRVRVESENNKAGIITVKLSYKTFP